MDPRLTEAIAADRRRELQRQAAMRRPVHVHRSRRARLATYLRSVADALEPRPELEQKASRL